MSRSPVSLEKPRVTYGCTTSSCDYGNFFNAEEVPGRAGDDWVRRSHGSVEAKEQTSWEAVGETLLLAYLHVV